MLNVENLKKVSKEVQDMMDKLEEYIDKRILEINDSKEIHLLNEEDWLRAVKGDYSTKREATKYLMKVYERNGFKIAERTEYDLGCSIFHVIIWP